MSQVNCYNCFGKLDEVIALATDFLCLKLINKLQSCIELRQGYPLNLNILLSGGKETNKDFFSNGE